ncbi:DUF4350 domain-containing protein [Luteimonas sp. SDU101]|uniref:DUF4350 domain-containing protein n=1 Tax=Luteimonas sp. SDU101 TaxID=3422593 RepID=UPI003EBC70F1
MGAVSRLRTPALVALGLVCAGLLAAWWNHRYERVVQTRPLPPAGEAAYNPLYALRLALRADGIEAQSRQRLDFAVARPDRRDTVLLLGNPRTLAQRDVEALLDWVDAGGHLLLTTPRGQRLPAPREVDLLDGLGLTLRPGQTSCEELHFPGQEPHTEFCGGTRFVPRVDPLLSWGDFSAGFAYVRLARGEGLVDVLASADFLTNDGLREVPHLALARQLLAPNYGHGRMHLVYAADMPPLWRLLLERAWMAWLPLLLALLAWLWMRVQRIGPAMPAPPQERRSLLEHVQASGEHLRRHGLSSLLHAAMREDFLARLRRRDPLAAALEGVAQAEAIAARTGLPAPDIEHALRSPRPRDAGDFRLRVARLVEMRKRL